MKNKIFLATSSIILAIVIILSMVPQIVGLFSSDSEQFDEHGNVIVNMRAEYGIVADRDVFNIDVLSRNFHDINWVFLPDSSDFEELIRNGTYANILVLEPNNLDYTIYYRGDSLAFHPGQFHAMVIDANQVQIFDTKDEATQASIIEVLTVSPNSITLIPVGADIQSTFWYAYVLMILLFTAIIMYSSIIATSVVTEKSTKTMELLITSTKPTNLLFGKVLGTGCAGLLQFFTLISVGLGSLILNSDAWVEMMPAAAGIFEFSNINALFFVYMFLFFVLGFFIAAFLIAALASTIDRIENIQTATIFPNIIFIASFYSAIAGIFQADEMWVRILSYVPFFSQSVMFMRICVGSAETWEVVLSLVILFVSTVVMGIISAKIYKIGVMIYGKKLTQVLFPKKFK
jgi:ABC-2 type transport system permease protein